MLKELVLSSIVSLVGSQTNLIKDSIIPTNPFEYGLKQVEFDGPGPVVSYKERFTYSVVAFYFDIIYEDIRTFKNLTSSVFEYDFSNFIVPSDTFDVVSYSSVSSNATKLSAVKDLVNADNLDTSYYYDHPNVVLSPNISVTYGVEQEKLTLQIEEVKETRHWSWFSWSDYVYDSASYFHVIHRNYNPFVEYE